jgi:hypothetical protein
MLLFDFTPDLAASEGHVSHPENGYIRIEACFDKELPDAITYLLYRDYDNSVCIYLSRNVATYFS